MSQDDANLVYFISNKNSILVVTFAGPMDSSQADVLLRCKNELADFREIELVILYFRDVPLVSGDAIQILTHTQKDIRSRPCQLSICSLKPEVREKLMAHGIVREAELSNNLQAALQSFLTNSKQKRK